MKKNYNFSEQRKSLEPLIFPGFVNYLPQHCLYFLPLPHAVPLCILYILSILSVLLVFSTVWELVTFNIFNINCAYFHIKDYLYANKLRTFLTYHTISSCTNIILYTSYLINNTKIVSITFKIKNMKTYHYSITKVLLEILIKWGIQQK